jgi:DNA gyrase subunit A
VKAAGVKKGDAVFDVVLSDGNAEVMLLSRSGRAIRFVEDDVSVVGRTAQGVKGIDLRDDDEVVGMVLIRRDAAVLTLTEDGMGKRTPVGEFPLQKRGGLGTLAVPGGERAARVVSALEVLDADEVMVITAAGQVARVAASSVPLQGRRTQGRRLLDVARGDRVVEVTRAQGGDGSASPGEAGSDEDEQFDLLGD